MQTLCIYNFLEAQRQVVVVLIRRNDSCLRNIRGRMTRVMVDHLYQRLRRGRIIGGLLHAPAVRGNDSMLALVP